MADLCLGTVQFGMKYGINNRQGQPSMNDSVEMIKYAVDNGVKYIDTARACSTWMVPANFILTGRTL